MVHSKTRMKNIVEKLAKTESEYYLQLFKRNAGVGNETRN